MSIRQRLIIGFGITLALLGAQAGATLRWRRRLSGLATEESAVIEPRLEAAQALEAAILAQEVALRAYGSSHDPADLARYRRARARQREVLNQLAALPADPASGAVLRRMTPPIDEFAGLAGALVAKVQRGEPPEAIQPAASRLATLRGQLQGLTEDLRAVEERAAAAALAAGAQARAALMREIVLLSTLVAAAVAATGLLTIRAVRGPAERLRRAARALATGDYGPALALAPAGAQASDAFSRDELKELAAAFGRMAAQLRDRQERAAAEARLAAALAGSFDVERLARAALGEVLAYARADVGVVWARDVEPGLFRRVAAVAADGAPFGLRAGDGVPGEALAQGRTLVVRDIPSDTPFVVDLGLAAAPPRTVVATPLLFQDEPVGVMVVGSLRDLDDGAVDFFEQAARQLGVSLSNALGHREVAGLAAALRGKNEQLQTQHRELRAHHEALQARDEQLERQNEELEAQRRELRQRAEELSAANRHKDEFLAMLGHELRNPLAAIRSATYVLGHDGDAATSRPRGIIARQTEHLARLVDDLLDVSRLSRGLIQLNRQPLDLREVLDDAVEAARRAAAARRLPLTLRLPDRPLWVDGDAVRLGQVVGNVVGNAIKFSEPGGRIQVTATAHDSRIVVRVTDEGIGIAPDVLPRVFELFVQGEQDPAHARGGLGLGLALARRLTEMHDGRIAVHSAGAARGTEVEIDLPARAAPAVAPPPRGAPAPGAAERPRRVVLIEDQADVGEALGLMIEALGHTVRQARNGAAGIALCVADPPDVVLLDIGLPGLDGYAVAHRLREQLPAHSRPRLVALTGYTQPEDRRRALAAGFDTFLAKPVELETLRATLAAPRPEATATPADEAPAD